jgi:hypothetical protein
VQKLPTNPEIFERLLTLEIEGLNRLVDRAMKKKPKRVEQVKEACMGA